MLRYIAEHQPVAVTTMSKELKMSIGSTYHHLNKLGTFVTQDQNKHYLISNEGRAFLQGEIPEPIEWRRFHANSVLVANTESLSEYYPTARLLRFIALNGSVSVKQMKESLDMSVGSIYHHLTKLGHLLEQDEHKRYRLSNESLALVRLDAKQEEQKEVPEVPVEVPKEVLELKAQTEFIPRRVLILKFLQENPNSGIARIKDHLNTDKNTAKWHLRRLSKYVLSDRYGRYSLSPLGAALLARHQLNYAEIYKFLLQEAKASIKRTRKDELGTLGIRAYRTIYDMIAKILGSKEPAFSISWVIKKVVLSSKRAENILSFMKEKGLIHEVKHEYGTRRSFKVTQKGKSYLRKFNELLDILR